MDVSLNLSICLIFFGIRFSRYDAMFPLLAVFSAMGLSGLEPPTSRLSGVRSNRLSYKPRLLSKCISAEHIAWKACFPKHLFLMRYKRRSRGMTNRRFGIPALMQHILPISLLSVIDWISTLLYVVDYHLQVETKRFELSTPCLQGRCSPN